MISPTSGLSLSNTSLPDKICDAIIATGNALKAIRVTDLPTLWESIVTGFKHLGQALVQQVKDFFFKDLPGLLFDIGKMVGCLIKKDYDNVFATAKSALNHLMSVLEVLSLVPLFAVACSVLLAAIYFCQKDWVNAVCALI